jgi:hypothetical protein
MSSLCTALEYLNINEERRAKERRGQERTGEERRGQERRKGKRRRERKGSQETRENISVCLSPFLHLQLSPSTVDSA